MTAASSSRLTTSNANTLSLKSERRDVLGALLDGRGHASGQVVNRMAITSSRPSTSDGDGRRPRLVVEDEPGRARTWTG